MAGTLCNCVCQGFNPCWQQLLTLLVHCCAAINVHVSKAVQPKITAHRPMLAAHVCLCVANSGRVQASQSIISVGSLVLMKGHWCEWSRAQLSVPGSVTMLQ
jgi:hypothetical protein